MRNSPTSKSKFARFGRPAIAAAVLALAASASYAGAVVNVTSFMITTDGIPFVAPKFAMASNPESVLTSAARNGGGVFGSSTPPDYIANNWNDSANLTAQTSAAVATGNVISFTDALTGLQTGGFRLNASTTLFPFGPPGNATTAQADGGQTGGFTLLDNNDAPVAGTLTFDIFYDLSVSTTVGTTPQNFTEAFLSFSAVDEDGFFGSLSDSLASYALNPGFGSKSGQFSLTFDLAAGEIVQYSLAGRAFASAASVPEPGGVALAMFGLLAAGGASYRKTRRQA